MLPRISARRRNLLSNEDLNDWFSGYPSYAAQVIRSPDDIELVRLALAGALIEDSRTDIREVYAGLSRLCLAAERGRIDPVPHFESVGTPQAKSSPPSRGLYKLIGSNYSQSLLQDFLNSGYFRAANAGEG